MLLDSQPLGLDKAVAHFEILNNDLLDIITINLLQRTGTEREN